MTQAALILHAIFVFGVAASGALALATVAYPSLTRAGRLVSTFTVAVGLLGLTARTIAAGHLPIFGTFENTYTAAWALMLAGVIVSYRTRVIGAWRMAAPWAIVLLLYGFRFRSEPVPLTISEQSFWVDIHVAFAWLAFTGFIAASTLSIAALAGKPVIGLEGDELDLAHQRLMLVSFLNFCATLILGSWYLYVLFGTFWKWEIVETLCLIAWLLYAILVHGRLFYGWAGRWYHVGVLGVLPVLLLSYWIWSVFPGTYHFFDIPLVRPY